MTEPRHVAVIDIGKTNAKLALVDLHLLTEIVVRKRPNTPLASGLYPHFDVEGIWDFLCVALTEFNRTAKIEAISVTTHGAAAALVDEKGKLALPVLDYECPGPDALDADYARMRPDFAESFTPPLPGGLNLGKQLFWQAHMFPAAFARTRHILTYPQYWSFRLTGVLATELTSLGCHTDLWDFRNKRLSSMVEELGWTGKFAPLRRAGEILGKIHPELARALGLDPDVPVHAGIHDSNASLLPHVLRRAPPFAVVSTGTWVVVCAPGGDLSHLDASRDSFANIDALGRAVPSARFMGGREYSQLTSDVVRTPSESEVGVILRDKIFLLPSVTPGSGPFPTRRAQLTVERSTLSPEAYYAIVSFYLALMTRECLGLTGAKGDIVVEGPFAANPLYLEMLAAATGRSVLAEHSSSTGTAIGAALLANIGGAGTTPVATRIFVGKNEKAMIAYATAWLAATRINNDAR